MTENGLYVIYANAISQQKRKRVEEIFGWAKTIALFRKTRYRGVQRAGWMFTFALAVYNLVRHPEPDLGRCDTMSPPDPAHARLPGTLAGTRRGCSSRAIASQLSRKRSNRSRSR
jgi:hypothetical protein